MIKLESEIKATRRDSDVTNAMGPASLEEMMMWPFVAIDSVAFQNPASFSCADHGPVATKWTLELDDCPELARVVRHLSRPMDVYSRYTGLLSDKAIFVMLTKALRARSIVVGESIRYVSCGDIEPHVQRLLVNMPCCFRPEHVHKNLLNQLPVNIQDEMYSLGMPPNKSDLRFKGDPQAFSRETLQWMKSMRGLLQRPEAWPKDAKEPCLICGQPCLAEVPRQRGALKVGFGGWSCGDWSIIGQGKNMAGHTAKPFTVFFMEMKMRDFGCFFGECTPSFYAWLVKFFLGTPWEIIAVIVSSEDCGYPCGRNRYLCFAYNRERLCFLGNPTRFFDLFARRKVLLPADVYWCMDQGKVDARLKGIAKDMYLGDGATWLDTVAGGSRVRLDYYIKLMEKDIAEGKLDADAAFVCDIDHNPDVVRRSGSQRLPCLITHGILHSKRHEWRLLLGDEHLFVQGHPMEPMTIKNQITCDSVTFESIHDFDAAGTSERERKHLAGNGQHLPTVGAFVFWCLGHVEKIEDVSAMLRRILPTTEHLEHENEDEEIDFAIGPYVLKQPFVAV